MKAKHLLAILAALHAVAVNASDSWLHEARFNGDASGWAKENGAVWTENVGRSGGSLKLSTWEKDGRQGLWRSPMFKVEGKSLNVGAWSAQCMAYAQEPYYCGILAIVFFDGAQKELSKNKLVDFVMEPRRYNLEGLPMIPEGLNWNYYKGGTDIPAGANNAQLVFAWAAYYEPYRSTEEITGAVWVDDITVQTGEVKTELKADDAQKPCPFQMGLRTPVDINLFTTDDPMQFDVLIHNGGTGAEPSRQDVEGASLEYSVTDFQRQLVDTGGAPFLKGKSDPLTLYQWEEPQGSGKPAVARSGLLKTIHLGEKVRAAMGQWLALDCKLVKNGKTLAAGDISFAILKPDMDYSGEDPEKFHFIRGHACGKGRNLDIQVGNAWKAGEPSGDPWKPGRQYPTWLEKLNSKGVAWLGWSSTKWAVKEGEKPDFSKFGPEIKRFSPTNRELEFSERLPAYTYCVCLPQNSAPSWVARPKDGKWCVIPEAYAQFQAEDVKHTAATTFFPGGCEALDPIHFSEALAAGAKAIKQVDKRLKVGVVAAHLSLESARSMPKEILESVDIFVDDIYNERVDALPFKGELAKRGFPGKEVWLQEHCDMVARDLIPRSKTMLSYISYALAHGVDKLYWWASPGEPVVMGNPAMQWSYGPDLRGPFILKTDRVFNAGWRTSGPGIWPSAEKQWLPFPELVTQYHVNNYLGFAYDPVIVKISQDCEVYLFKNQHVPGFKSRPVTVLAGFQVPGGQTRAYIVESTIPFSWVDIFGRPSTVHPLDGKIMLSLGEDPILGNFHGEIGKMELRPAPVAVAIPKAIVAGAQAKVTVSFANPVDRHIKGTVSLRVGSGWETVPSALEYSIDRDGKASFDFTLTPPSATAPGDYPLFVTFKDENNSTWGELQYRFPIVGAFAIAAESMPAARVGATDAIRVLLTNNSNTAVSGKLCFTNPIITALRPELHETPCSIPAGGTSTLEIPLKATPERTRGYGFEFAFQPNGGRRISQRQDIFFIGAAPVDKPIKIDADPSDWDVDNLIPLIFFKDYFPKAKDYVPGVYMEKHGRGWTGKDDAYVKFYLRWDSEHLYWLAVITDNQKTRNNLNLDANSYSWCFDKLVVCLYPWAFDLGDAAKGCSYKTEFGLGLNGKPNITPRQNPMGAANADGIQFAARETPSGYIFEGAYSRESLRPLSLQEGSRFRLAMEYHDMDEPIKRYICDGVMWFAGCGNVSGDINLFGQVTLTGKAVGGQQIPSRDKP